MKIERDETNKEGWFILNDCVRVRYNVVNDETMVDIEFDDKLITQEDAEKLANELLKNVIEFFN